MAKGAGMLAPGLATMLVVLTTDADLPSEALDAALRAATRVTFDRLDSDGCMSTNDTVALLGSGASGITPHAQEFTEALTEVCQTLAQALQQDAEGASHDITIEVVHAATEDDAVEVGRAVARSNLFKTAIFGNDPNWGRVLASVGTTSAAFDPYGIDVTINGIRVCRAGGPDQPRELVDLTPRAAHVLIDLGAGRRARQHPHQRPHPRLRAREQRIRELMADDNWLQDHRGDTVVVKFGGNAMVDDALKRDFAADVVALLRAGIRPVVVHGGGPQISAALQRAGIPSEFRGGYRFTSTEAIQVVHDVLADEVSGELTALINEHGDYATRRTSLGSDSGEPSFCSPAGAAAWWSTGRRSTSATSATSTRSIRPRWWRCWMPAASRSSPRSPPTASIPAAASTSTRMPQPRPSRSRCGQAGCSCSPTFPACIGIGHTATRWSPALIPWNSRRCCPR